MPVEALSAIHHLAVRPILPRGMQGSGPDDGGFNYELQLVPVHEQPDIVASV